MKRGAGPTKARMPPEPTKSPVPMAPPSALSFHQLGALHVDVAEECTEIVCVDS